METIWRSNYWNYPFNNFSLVEMTPNERWANAKQTRKTANIIYLINLAILISIFIAKCGSYKAVNNTVSSFNSNARVTSSNGANIRQSPSITAKIITKVKNYDRILIIDSLNHGDFVNGHQGNWFKVRTQNGQEGFIWSATIRQDE